MLFTMEESNFILFPQHDHTVLYIDHSDIVHISAQIPDHLEGKKHPDHMAPPMAPHAAGMATSPSALEVRP